MKENERLRMVIPGGELEENVISFLKAIGLDFTVIPRRYLHRGR